MSDSFDDLRLRLEAGRSLPLTVCIASATKDDGAVNVAYGLASAFAGSGARALAVLESDSSGLMELPPQAISSLSTILKGAVVTQPNGVDTVCLRAWSGPDRRVQTRTVSRERRVDARGTILALRETYQAIVIEASEASVRSAMLERATLADIAIVAVRIGRAKCAADRALMERLDALGVPVLGIVSSPSAKTVAALGRSVKRALAEPLTVPGRT